MSPNRYQATTEQYEAETAQTRPAPFLYKLLRKFEIHRLDKVSQMIHGPKMKVLEVGCGDGKFLFKNKEKWKSVVGVDVMSSLLRKAKKRDYGVPSEFIRKDFGIDTMPFKENTFDLIACISTIQYILDLDLFFSQSHVVLKRNGRLVIEVPNSAVFWRRISFLFGHLPRTSEYENKWEGGVIHYITQKNIVSFLEKKGFVIEQIACSGVFDKLRSRWPDLLGGDLVIIARKV